MDVEMNHEHWPRPRWYITRLYSTNRGFWWQIWTPKWGQGRGPYVSIGFYFFAVYRGY